MSHRTVLAQWPLDCSGVSKFWHLYIRFARMDISSCFACVHSSITSIMCAEVKFCCCVFVFELEGKRVLHFIGLFISFHSRYLHSLQEECMTAKDLRRLLDSFRDVSIKRQ